MLKRYALRQQLTHNRVREDVMNYKTRIGITLAIFCFSILSCGLASADEGQPCPGDPVDMHIGYGAAIICSIDAPGTSDLFRFDGIAGERIQIEVIGSSSPCIELVGVKTACNGYPYHQEWIDVVLPTTQQYTIRVYDYYNGTGSYDLFLERTFPHSPDAGQITYGQNLANNFSPSGDLDEYFFVASAGDLMDITVTTGSLSPCFTIYGPDASTVGSACNGYPYHSEELRKMLTVTGTYTVLLYEYYGSTGTYNTSFYCLQGPCVVTPIPDLSGYLTLRGAPLPNQTVGIVTPGPGGQTTTTDMNGYFQFLHVPNGNFTEYAPISAHDNDASANSVHASPDR